MILCVYNTLSKNMRSTKKKYKYAVIATDVVILTIKNSQLQVLLIKMKKAPYAGIWAAPGGLIKSNESVDNAAHRILMEKTDVKDVYLEQLYTFGEVNRDPFGRVVSVAYFALIPSEKIILKTTKEYGDVGWFPINRLPKLAYDHAKIINVAQLRLKAKLGYSNIVYGLLPKQFSLSELQKIYEIILERKFDKRNFRKKVFSLNLVKTTGEQRQGEANRPASMYSFINKRYQIMEILKQ